MGRLPWIACCIAVALYGLTAGRWLTAQSALATSQVAGWGGDFPADAPLLWLVSRPWMALPTAMLPVALNWFTVLLGGAVAWTLARCVQLLPQDRSYVQRVRGYVDGKVLAGRWAWVPPVLACGMFLPQLTAWEHGTSMTGEMLNVLVFGHAIRCLLEYRAGRRGRWLDGLALTMGAGMANNWAMVGFMPLFAVALFWIGGLEIVRVRLLARLAGLGLAGMSLYLVPALFAQGRGGLPETFHEALWAVLQTQKGYLLGLPKPRFILLASVMLAPLMVSGFPGGHPQGSRLEQVASFGALLVVRVVWLAANVWMVFDGPLSPRQLVSLVPEAGSLPLLTFCFGAALSVAQVAGYFLVCGMEKPSPQRAPIDLADGAVHGGIAWLVVAAAPLVPAALVARNLPVIREQNGPVLAILADAMVAPLPKEPSILLTDNPVVYTLVHARLAASSGNPGHMPVNVRAMPDAAYRRSLARLHGKRWERLDALAAAKENIGGEFLGILGPAAQSGHAFSTGYFLSFITESHYLQPAGTEIGRAHV